MHLSDANKEKQIDNYVAMVTKSVTIETNLLIIITYSYSVHPNNSKLYTFLGIWIEIKKFCNPPPQIKFPIPVRLTQLCSN